MNIENKDELRIPSFRFDATISNGRLRNKSRNPTGRAGVLVASSSSSDDRRNTLPTGCVSASDGGVPGGGGWGRMEASGWFGACR